ncbi:MAG: HAMP domain-containing histidine kinase [Muribaculaceae bacterium]|nr:HAMP domain-containing histidine kinase [Muribaculaceae bacterium]
MKKSTIWFLTIIMALTFIGLLYVQIMYMGNMIRMRDDQFAEGVKRSLYAVSTMLEQDETKHFLEEDVARIESSSIYAQYSDGSAPHLDGVKYSFTTSTGVEADLTIKGDVKQLSELQSDNVSMFDRTRTMQEVLRGQYLYQKGLIDEVILNIISQSSNRPIEERADSAVVRNYLKSEFENNGLDLPFEFAVVNRNGVTAYKTSGYDMLFNERGGIFVQTLFPNDPANKINYLKVYFPDKKNYIFSSIRFMIPSFMFTFILLVIFLYTIIIAFRQKKLTEMKNDFINNMTHEFKTPISTISLAAQMLNDDSVRKSSNMLQHISTVINDETKRLRFQVEKVLQMSMFDRQKATLKLQDVDANSAIANIVHTFKIKVEKYGGHIESELNAEDAIVNVDEMHFTNVIFNLLDNAVKYRREDVSLSLVVTTSNLPGDRLEITVGDNGIGIKKENLKKVFEKFYRVSTGNRHDVKGFGLGLAYVQKMVRELKGDIRVESELNVGTKFIIILPLTKN